MREISRVGNMPQHLAPLLEQGEKVVQTMASMSSEDIPIKTPVVYECDTVEEVLQRTMDGSGQPQVTRDAVNERVYIVGLCFGRRSSNKAIMDIDQSPTEEWRTVIYFTEMSDGEWVNWRENWNIQKQQYIDQDKAQKEIAANQREALRKKRAKFKKTYGR